MGLLTSTFLLSSCQSLCQLNLGMRLFIFISILCFFCVFISKVPSCISQLQWKARDTTECGSRFNRFHAISTALRGVCLPLAEERLSHTGGFSNSWYSPTRVWWTEGNEAVGFVPKHSLFPTCIWPQPDGFSWNLAEMRSRWGAICSA